MPLDKKKQRARWQRNKQAERARKRSQPRKLSPQFERAVFFERDWRLREGLGGMSCWKGAERFYRVNDPRDRAYALMADVWAARTLIEARISPRRASPTLIRDELKRLGYTHGYTDGSLRKLIYKALERIKRQETESDNWWRSPQHVHWPPFRPLMDYGDIFAVIMNGNTKCKCGRWLVTTQHSNPSPRNRAAICRGDHYCG